MTHPDQRIAIALAQVLDGTPDAAEIPVEHLEGLGLVARIDDAVRCTYDGLLLLEMNAELVPSQFGGVTMAGVEFKTPKP